MKNVLIISYYFPPSGGPGVQRVLKFTKYLPEFGWQPIILTVKDADYPARDESLLDEIPKDVPVYRTKIFEPYGIYRKFTGKKYGAPVDVNTIPKPGERRSFSEQLAEFIRATFFIPDARIGWYGHAVKKGIEIIKEHRVQALYSSSPPYTCSLIARKLKHKTALPWVAGFRDPWRGFLSTPERWLLPAMIDKHFERATFSECDAMEVAWNGIIKDFSGKYPEMNVTKCHHLPNGFDSSDFPRDQFAQNEKFTVTYTGSMYGKRNPSAFLKAVRLGIEQKLVDPKCLQLQFIGRFGDEIHEMFKDPVLLDSIVVRSYVPHSESIKELFRSDDLLMIVDDFKGNEEIVPGKVFEYIGAAKPIITIAPEGAIANLIRETQSGEIAHSDDVESVMNIFVTYYENWKSGAGDFHQKSDLIRRYERREISRQLAELLDEVAGRK